MSEKILRAESITHFTWLLKKIIPALLVGLFVPFSCLSAQSDTTGTALALSDFSLEALMNISIYSASKSEESAFDAPLSSTVITHEEIKKAGCTTIMEALRLVPGVIVREVSNGNYDIHIRGLDNVPPNLGMYFFTNSTTLVMIDNRPVYNYLHGGTFWETLPVDLNDVEKIEVVRGPSAAMYGPNAVSGVINIITRKPEKQGWYAIANGQYGRFNTGIANASFGYKFKNNLSVHASGNFQTRERTQRDYYVVAKDAFVPLDTFIPNDSIQKARYPHPKLAMRKYGYNAFINYQINEKAWLSISGGGQTSEVQNEFASTYMATAKSTSYYAALRAGVYGLNVQASYLAGTQSPQTGVIQWKWDYNTADVVLDYNMTAVKHLVITPGISYRRAQYDDRKYVNEALKEGFFNDKVVTNQVAAYLRIDYKAFREKLRLIASARIDKFFGGPKKITPSWVFAATYKPTPNHLLRIVASRASRAPLLIDNFLDVATPFYTPQTGPGVIDLLGNTELKLLTTDMLEIGYRGKLQENFEIGLEVFGSHTKNFSNIILETFEYDTAAPPAYAAYVFQNIPLETRQFGITLSFNYVTPMFQFKPFLTFQHTILYNYSPFTISPDLDSSFFFPSPETDNVYSGMGTNQKHLATPAVFGGAYLNIHITPQLNLNINPYFMSGSTQLENSNLTYKDGKRGVEKLAPRLIMNVVASYTFFKKLTLFVNFKNCINTKTREFMRADLPQFKVSGGINFEF